MHPGTSPVTLAPSIESEVDGAHFDSSDDDEAHDFDERNQSLRVRILELYRS